MSLQVSHWHYNICLMFSVIRPMFLSAPILARRPLMVHVATRSASTRARITPSTRLRKKIRNFVTISLPRSTCILAQCVDIEKGRSSALHVALASSSRVRRHGGGARIVIASPGAASGTRGRFGVTRNMRRRKREKGKEKRENMTGDTMRQGICR